jgi:hypothetical protein
LVHKITKNNVNNATVTIIRNETVMKVTERRGLNGERKYSLEGRNYVINQVLSEDASCGELELELYLSTLMLSEFAMKLSMNDYRVWKSRPFLPCLKKICL